MAMSEVVGQLQDSAQAKCKVQTLEFVVVTLSMFISLSLGNFPPIIMAKFQLITTALLIPISEGDTKFSYTTKLVPPKDLRSIVHPSIVH